MKFSLKGLFNDDPGNPRRIKTSMFVENSGASGFLHKKFRLFAIDFGRAQLVATRNKDNTYDITAKYHGRRHGGYAPLSEPVLLGAGRDITLATLYAFEKSGILNNAPSDPVSRQTHLGRELDKLARKSGHVVKIRKDLGITKDDRLVVADQPRPRPPPPPPMRPKQPENPLLASHMKRVKKRKNQQGTKP